MFLISTSRDSHHRNPGKSAPRRIDDNDWQWESSFDSLFILLHFLHHQICQTAKWIARWLWLLYNRQIVPARSSTGRYSDISLGWKFSTGFVVISGALQYINQVPFKICYLASCHSQLSSMLEWWHRHLWQVQVGLLWLLTQALLLKSFLVKLCWPSMLRPCLHLITSCSHWLLPCWEHPRYVPSAFPAHCQPAQAIKYIFCFVIASIVRGRICTRESWRYPGKWKMRQKKQIKKEMFKERKTWKTERQFKNYRKT